jgi:hypothetical protein
VIGESCNTLEPGAGYRETACTSARAPFRVILRAISKHPTRVHPIYVALPYDGPVRRRPRYDFEPAIDFDHSQQVRSAIDIHAFDQARLMTRLAAQRRA